MSKKKYDLFISMVKKIIVKKVLSDEETNALEGKKLPQNYYKNIYNEDIDVYTEDGDILLRFRKNVLPKTHIDDAYNGMIQHARQKTSTRGVTGGPTGKVKIVQNNAKIASNIMGYFDTLSLKQKWMFREANMKKPICRKTAFTAQEPEKWIKIVPLIVDIDRQYKKLFPEEHALQLKAAQSTDYVIADTAFSTITTNLNLQTASHTDKGDYMNGFGNLVVIEKGDYDGGYTGFPQYGIAVDVRTGDFLGMDVHQLHGNTPIIPKTENAERLSIVSYLREGIVEKCQGLPLVSEKYFEKARKKLEKMGKIKKAKIRYSGKETRKIKKSSKKTKNSKTKNKTSKQSLREKIKHFIDKI